ncbi:hypothetical protein V4U86_27825 [Mycobacterium sp. AMU20-3851]|uniref:hypothetical protein n=1 Tax=Mycobacterium sp. AMU20-3851 TaxID=3122055 RepID=UPI003755262F
MNIVSGTVGAIGRTADAAAATAGAIGGAAVNGVIGGIKGTGSGIRSGMSQGSRSSAAAALTFAAVGAAGLIEWPVLLTVGGATLLVHEINQRTRDGQTAESDDHAPVRTAAPVKRTTARSAPKTPAARTARKASTSRAAPKAATRRSAPRRTGSSAGK